MTKEMASLRSEMTKDIASLRSDMEKGFALVRSEMDKSAETLRSELTKDITSLRSELVKDIGSVSSIMDERFKSSNRLSMIIQALVPFASAVITIGLLVALANLGNSPQSAIWLI